MGDRVAASAFGVGAARVMGRSDQAYKLAAEALAASWPLPGGTLLAPRILSNVSDAPYLGEAATIFALTRRPPVPLQGDRQARPPAIVYVSLLVPFLLGMGEIAVSLRKLRRWRRDTRVYAPWPRAQVLAWGLLLVGALGAWLLLSPVVGLVVLLAALVLPWQRRGSLAQDVPVATQGTSR